MRPFDSIAALVEDRFKKSDIKRIKEASSKCFFDNDFRGTTKTTESIYCGEWISGEYRLTREEADLDLGWSPTLSYNARAVARDRKNVIAFNAVTGFMSDGSIGRIVKLTIITDQMIPEVLWANAGTTIGQLIELPSLFKDMASCHLDELQCLRTTSGSQITGQFDLHRMEAGENLHQSRPASPAMLHYKAELNAYHSERFGSLFR